MRAPLPIDERLDELRQALRAGHALLVAPTGSGKSTAVPLALRDEPWLAGQRILLLEPRRPAARLTAARMAALCGEALGETVGYQVRFERCVGPQTRIEVLTEGILTRRLQSDPALSGVGLLIFDEFHERSLEAELALALALDVTASLRPDLRLLLMSATLDEPALAALLGAAPIVRGTGRLHPVTIRYAEQPPKDPVAAVLPAVYKLLAEQSGDVLAFLPGTRAIAECQSAWRAPAGVPVEVVPLHGSLPSAEQDRALRAGPPGRRRVILATDLAETSVTIPGIGAVVDSGLTRKPRFNPRTGLTRLHTEPISRASAAQRAGRAGRLGPGVCERLWTLAQERTRPDQRPPEIRHADLAPLVLQLAVWGVTDPQRLRWLEPPPAAAWQQAVDLLRALGALDAAGRATARGQALAAWPLHPRLATMLCAAAPSARALAADLAAVLSERDPLSSPATDLGLRLGALAAYRRGVLATCAADARRLAHCDRVARQLQQLAARLPVAPTGGARGAPELLALAYPEWIAQRRAGQTGRYLLASGSGAVLPAEDALGTAPYLAVAALDGASGEHRIRLALPLEAATVAEIAAARIVTARELVWDEERAAVACRTISRLDALRLDVHACPIDDPAAARALLLEQVAARFATALDWNEDARQLQARVALLRRLEPAVGWPDWSDDALRATLATWLAPALGTATRLAETRALDLSAVLLGALDWSLRQRLDEQAPRVFVTPAGTRRRIDYRPAAGPVLAVALQELFGTEETPRIAGGRVPLVLHLLSPARRPLQVTSDLASFWRHGYAAVRKELRGRYPRHPWPEDPRRAPAVAGPKRRPA